MQSEINKTLVLTGIVIPLVIAVLVRLSSLFPSFIPQSIIADRRSFGVSVVPPMTGTRAHLAPIRSTGLPMHHPQHLGSSYPNTSVPNSPPAYTFYTADRYHNGSVNGCGNVGTPGGISVAVVPASSPPPHPVGSDETQ